jgi:hypothetical protein
MVLRGILPESFGGRGCRPWSGRQVKSSILELNNAFLRDLAAFTAEASGIDLAVCMHEYVRLHAEITGGNTLRQPGVSTATTTATVAANAGAATADTATAIASDKFGSLAFDQVASVVGASTVPLPTVPSTTSTPSTTVPSFAENCHVYMMHGCVQFYKSKRSQRFLPELVLVFHGFPPMFTLFLWVAAWFTLSLGGCMVHSPSLGGCMA